MHDRLLPVGQPFIQCSFEQCTVRKLYGRFPYVLYCLFQGSWSLPLAICPLFISPYRTTSFFKSVGRWCWRKAVFIFWKYPNDVRSASSINAIVIIFTASPIIIIFTYVLQKLRFFVETLLLARNIPLGTTSFSNIGGLPYFMDCLPSLYSAWVSTASTERHWGTWLGEVIYENVCRHTDARICWSFDTFPVPKTRNDLPHFRRFYLFQSTI